MGWYILVGIYYKGVYYLLPNKLFHCKHEQPMVDMEYAKDSVKHLFKVLSTDEICERLEKMEKVEPCKGSFIKPPTKVYHYRDANFVVNNGEFIQQKREELNKDLLEECKLTKEEDYYNQIKRCTNPVQFLDIFRECRICVGLNNLDDYLRTLDDAQYFSAYLIINLDKEILEWKTKMANVRCGCVITPCSSCLLYPHLYKPDEIIPLRLITNKRKLE
jgi:excinuclease UvrABC helicase subunit UvrB